MNQFDKKRKKIYNFIIQNLSEYDIERTDYEEWIFDNDSEPNLQKLYKLNKQKLLEASDEFITYLLLTIKFIKQNKLHNMDKESMVSFPTSGFWDAKGHFTLFNER
jgi:hypothetical protein